MALRMVYFNFIALTLFLLLLYAQHASLTSSRNAGQARTSKKKGNGTVRLSVNIAENPFLKEVPTLNVNYTGNPFLTPIQSNLQSRGNDSGVRVTHTLVNPFISGSDKVNFSIGIRNPFLQPGATDTSSRYNTVLVDTPSTAPSQNSQYDLNDAPADAIDKIQNAVTPSSSPYGDSTRSKSDLKCEEYNAQILGTVDVVSLIGSGSGVVKVNNERCGRFNSLVVGGTVAKPGEFPHMVALGRRLEGGSFFFFCGGTLISPSWVLTAAHCTYGPNGSPTEARIGFHKLNDDNSGLRIAINRSLRNPSYHPPAMYADIALVELQNTVTFGRLIRPACLYQQFDTVPMQAWVSGWGVTEFGGEQSDKLQKALLEIIDNVVCSIRHNRSLAVPYGISPSMICAGDPRGGWNKDTCQGDSGGPLQIPHPRYSCLAQVIGITSFGEGCALVDSPGVYTRVSHYLTWIEDIVWPEE